MELVFTESVRKADGDVKFPKGLVMDFPRDTWNQIASSHGKKLSEFTMSVEDMARDSVRSKSTAASQASSARPRVRVRKD